VSRVKHEAFINAPVERVWTLVSDIDRHPEWWPRIVETEVDEVAPGATYRQEIETPKGSEVSEFRIEGMEDYKRLAIRCLNTGMFLQLGLTAARDGTFVEGEMGMDPTGIQNRIYDAIGGRRYFRTWIGETFAGLERAAVDQTPA
jgi:Polyketide cyclase / dehydrase and lipid transport